MRITKSEVPEVFSVPGAVARQILEFGDASDYGKMTGEYFSLASGTDITPLLQGLEEDLCQSPHWGYMISGRLTVTFSDGTEETARVADLFYWPPGHTLRVEEDAEIILFSPQTEHCATLDHLKRQLDH
ncbi:cupin domain-containing protein [Thioalkalivibrio sp.]|uniref:cupin domain-containing protein n=1 Tax=Thioalkalivibrio sp. TaxID=2093813 RepID=UPI0012D5C79A|nr:cupin domain-containing protein [Thioalkalivibrio sp.]TVP76999.1 MAG: cupin domain-containing protein [Thioalkalivibrio sp.]